MMYYIFALLIVILIVLIWFKGIGKYIEKTTTELPALILLGLLLTFFVVIVFLLVIKGTFEIEKNKYREILTVDKAMVMQVDYKDIDNTARNELDFEIKTIVELKDSTKKIEIVRKDETNLIYTIYLKDGTVKTLNTTIDDFIISGNYLEIQK